MPASAPTPAPAPVSAVPVAGPPADYVAKLNAVVQAAVVFPSAAREMNFRGRARVEFALRDGVPSHARVIVSSGMGMIDRAALQAVQAAAYPTTPVVFQCKVWVGFNY